MWESSQLLKVPWIPSSSWVHVGWKTARVRLNSNVFPDRPIDNEARTLAKQTRVIGCPRSWPNYQLHLVLLWLFGCGSFCFRWGNTCTCHPWICTCNASLQGVGRGFGWLAMPYEPTLNNFGQPKMLVKEWFTLPTPWVNTGTQNSKNESTQKFRAFRF